MGLIAALLVARNNPYPLAQNNAFLFLGDPVGNIPATAQANRRGKRCPAPTRALECFLW